MSKYKKLVDLECDRIVKSESSSEEEPRQLSRRRFLAATGATTASLLVAPELLGIGGSAFASDEGMQTLRLQIAADLESLDPAFQPNSVDYQIAYNIFENLVGYAPSSFELVNQLAEKWEGSDDGLTWTFKLREGVQFHGGYGELTSEDVKFSFERIAGLTDSSVDSIFDFAWSALKEVKTTGKYTGVIRLNQEFGPLMTTTIPLQPGQIVSKKAVLERGNDFATNPIGTGPYEFVKWNQNRSVELKAFKEYSGSKSQPFDRMTFFVIPNRNSAEAALRSGDLDFTRVRPQSVPRFKGSSYGLIEAPTLNYGFLGMNVQHENLRDKNIRLAIRYGLDQAGILEAAWDGRYRSARAIIAPGMPVGYWKDAPSVTRDVAKAKEYVAKAGAKGRKLELAFSPSEVGSKAVALVAQSNLADIGLDIELLSQEHTVFAQLGGAAQAKRQLFFTSYTSSPDPSRSTTWWTCEQINKWNWFNWCNKEYSSLDKEAMLTSDQAKRQQMYVKMQKLMEDDVVAVWLDYQTLFYAYNKSVQPAVRPDGRFVPWGFEQV